MKVVHFTVFAPSKSGMYESTKDQIKYERMEGLDSHLIDTVDPNRAGLTDDFITTADYHEALDADVWVPHSNIPFNLLQYIGVPKNRNKHSVVTILHGPVENMLLKEWLLLQKNIDEDGAFTKTHINAIWQYDACVCLDKHQYDISKLYDENDKLVYIPNSIDLERINDNLLYLSSGWPYRNRPAIISCDVPRIEKLPVHIVFAMSEVIKKIPSARLNMFALPFHDIEFFRNLFHRSKEWSLLRDCCENVQIKSNTLVPYIQGADIGFNSNYSGIASRVHMEMMAMGVPVVSYNGDYTKYHAKIFDIHSIAEQIDRCWSDMSKTKSKVRIETQEYAHKHFDRAEHVKTYVKLYEKLKEEKNGAV